MSNTLKELKAEWTKASPNMVRCGQLLDSLKLELLNDCFVTIEKNTPVDPLLKAKLEASRDMFEIGVEYSIKSKDNAAFERYMSQLKTYYYDYSKILVSSPLMHKYMGLHLLYLLATNRIADFHIELERLPSALLLENQFVSPVLALENYFVEGRYNKIIQAKKAMPSDLYANFMDLLVDTAREEIASCMEASFTKVSQKDAAARLGLKAGGPEMKRMVAKHGWIVDEKDNFNFEKLREKEKENMPAKEIAIHALTYAQELEKIV